MASLAEMERELTVERTRTGLEVARQLGRKGGRKPKMTERKTSQLKSFWPAACQSRTWPGHQDRKLITSDLIWLGITP